MVRGRNILKDYWDAVQDMLVVQVFYNCWKKLNLHLTDRMAHLIALKAKLKDKYNLQKEVSKMLKVDLGQHPVSLMVREAFMELQISDKVKVVLKVHYPQDPTTEYADVEWDCSWNESEEECLSLKEKEPMEFTVAKAQKYHQMVVSVTREIV